MNPAASPLIPAFLIFCRVGGCLMMAPAFFSERIPTRARLYLAIAVSLVIAPSVFEKLPSASISAEPMRLMETIAVEAVIGLTLGFLARLYFFALEMLATSVAMTFSLGNIFGAALTEPEPQPAFSSFVVLCAVTLVFCLDLHLEIIKALYQSYETAPVSSGPGAEALLREIAGVLTQSHLLALRLCSPFLLFGIVVNVALGLLSRLTPQVQIYFISGPAVIFLGLAAFALLSQDFFTAFSGNFTAWLLRG